MESSTSTSSGGGGARSSFITRAIWLRFTPTLLTSKAKRRASADSPTLVADAAGLAEALIVNDEKDSHWTNSARDLIKAIILHLVTTKGPTATLGDLRSLLTRPMETPDMVDSFLALADDMRLSPYPFVSQPATSR